MCTLETQMCDVIWLMNVNILFKFSANIKDSMGKFIMPLESIQKEVKEKLVYLTDSVEESNYSSFCSYRSSLCIVSQAFHWCRREKLKMTMANLPYWVCLCPQYHAFGSWSNMLGVIQRLNFLPENLEFSTLFKMAFRRRLCAKMILLGLFSAQNAYCSQDLLLQKEKKTIDL